MSRYIDAEQFAKNLSLLVYMADDEDFTQAFVKGMELVKKAEDMTPTADVVEVVRCKDCKYYNENKFTYSGDGYGRCDHPQQAFDCECFDMWVETTPDDYCSYGERSENDNT